jgi:hypothetical protein
MTGSEQPLPKEPTDEPSKLPYITVTDVTDEDKPKDVPDTPYNPDESGVDEHVTLQIDVNEPYPLTSIELKVPEGTTVEVTSILDETGKPLSPVTILIIKSTHKNKLTSIY